MKGFYTASGFCGLVEDRYLLFASEGEYYEYMKEEGYSAAGHCVL